MTGPRVEVAGSTARRRGVEFDRFIGRLLIAVTYFAVGLLTVGVILLFANGIYALNEEGLRNDTIIPAGGIEGTF